MTKSLIFGGTVEGRELAEARLLAGDDVVVCVTSDYARKLLPPGARCYARAMGEADMLRALRCESPDVVYDATHPFAARVTESLRRCAAIAGVSYQRLERPGGAGSSWGMDVEWVRDARAAAASLAATDGGILLTTGSHTLSVYASVIPVERLYARVLPTIDALRFCEESGLPPSHVIAMQGPFTRALNAALYDMLDIRAMVSKDSGEPGGVSDKVIPALERQIHVVMIRRPELSR
ncbi:MAG: precorrin-6A reductase [Oscillospiraceae bacterium]|nr:precorrin-6A reductase [Oscillospiraceae bacterium]